LYNENISEYLTDIFGSSWSDNRNKALRIIQEESELEEIVRLVGIEALSTRERIILETAKSIREDFLQQNAFDDEDAYSSLKKQHRIVKLVLSFYDESMARVDSGEEIDIDELFRLPVRVEVARAHFIPEEELQKFDELEKKLREAIRNI